MKQLRKIIFWSHLAAGALAGIIVLIMSATGVLLAYEKQVTAWADARSYPSFAPAFNAPRFSIEALLAKTRDAKAVAPSSITVRRNENAAVEIGYGREGTIFVNPYTGAVLSEGAKGARAFFRGVTDWHRWLATSGDARALGRGVTGACNLAFLFLVTSGFYLWLPRGFGWKQIKNATWFRRGLTGKARDFNWHNVIGFWCALPLFIVVLSGVVISYSWAGNLVYRLAGETPPAPRAATPNGNEAGRTQIFTEGLDKSWARAEGQNADWRSINLQIPIAADAPAMFTVDTGTGGQPQLRTQLTINRANGEITRAEPFSALTAGRRMRSILRFAHTGEVLGLTGQTIAALASLGAAFLVWTGFSLSWRRFRTWRTKRSNPRATTEAVTS